MKRFNMGGLRLAAAGLTLAVLAIGPGTRVYAQGAAAKQESYRPPPGAMIAPGPAPDLTLLYTGDVIGYVDPCG